MIEDVYFLGAGASKADGALLQNEIFRDYFSNNSYPAGDALNEGLRAFFEDFWGIDIADPRNDVDYPTFEEVLGILELGVSRGESFRDYPLVPERPRLQLVREQIVFLIARALRDKFSDEKLYHDRLIEHLRATGRLHRSAFISLNYDILIDNAISRRVRKIDLDYGVDFTNYEITSEPQRPGPVKSVRLYKLHGSLNWLYCPTCISLTLTPEVRRAATLVEKPQSCEKCGGGMLPILVPPSYLKEDSNIFLRQIRHKSEHVLGGARRIIFCGYSLPDADLNIKYMLKRMELGRDDTPEIIVFNSHPGKDEHARMVEHTRFRRFFRNPDHLDYTENSFEDLCSGVTGFI